MKHFEDDDINISNIEDLDSDLQDEALITDLDQPDTILHQRAQYSQRILRKFTPVALISLTLVLSLLLLWSPIVKQLTLLYPTPTPTPTATTFNPLTQHYSIIAYSYGKYAYILILPAVPTRGSILSEINLATGKAVWQFDEKLLSSPVLNGDYLYLSVKTGVIALNATTHKTIWKISPDNSTPYIRISLLNNTTALFHHLNDCDLVNTKNGSIINHKNNKILCDYFNFYEDKQLLYAFDGSYVTLSGNKQVSSGNITAYNVIDGSQRWKKQNLPCSNFRRYNDRILCYNDIPIINNMPSSPVTTTSTTATDNNQGSNIPASSQSPTPDTLPQQIESSNSIHIFDASDGTECWSLDTNYAFLTYPLPPDSPLVYVQDLGDNSIHAFDLYNGQEKWHAPLNTRVNSYFSSDGQTLYLLDDIVSKRLYAFDAINGHPYWSVPSTLNTLSWIEGQEILYGQDNDTLVAIRTQDGQEIWRYHLPASEGQGFSSSFLTKKSTIYINYASNPNMPSGIIALNSQNGQELWRQLANNQSSTFWPLEDEADSLFIIDNYGTRLNLLDPVTGKVKWRYQTTKLPE